MTSESTIKVDTKIGKLKGRVRISEGIAPTKFYSFQGIPYAKPPVGRLRFQPAQELEPWDGVLDATKEGAPSVQKHMIVGHPVGQEDCLCLNVYTPQLPVPCETSGSGLAVMVWIHGGGFNCGDGGEELYGPDFFIEQGVVLVTVNYRLGVLGFLSLETAECPGNQGLKDQCAALRWVRDHARSFGGDPQNVTLFGQSAGGHAVGYHLVSPMSRGLFQKVIVQSGSALASLQQNPRKKAVAFAALLGCTSQDPSQVLEFLMAVPPSKLLEFTSSPLLTSDQEKVQQFGTVWRPCVETSKGDSPFLPDHPRRLLEAPGGCAPVPIVLGVADQEGWILLEMKSWSFDRINDHPDALVPLSLTVPEPEHSDLGKRILKHYTGNELPLSWTNYQPYCDYIMDCAFVWPALLMRDILLRQRQSRKDSPPLFTYLFSYPSGRALSHKIIPKNYPNVAEETVGKGACHADELGLQFKDNLLGFAQQNIIPEDRYFIAKFTKSWTNFAKTGDPNCKELEVPWKFDSIETPFYLDFGKTLKTEEGTFFKSRVDIWRNIFEQYEYRY